jgi:hypothetical protein
MFGRKKKTIFNGPWSVRAEKDLVLIHENAFLKINTLVKEEVDIDMEKFTYDLIKDVAELIYEDARLMLEKDDTPGMFNSRCLTTVKNLTPEQAQEWIDKGFEVFPIPGTEKAEEKKPEEKKSEGKKKAK